VLITHPDQWKISPAKPNQMKWKETTSKSAEEAEVEFTKRY